MTRIFISYSRSDRSILDHLIVRIRGVFGQDCLWFDEDIPGGKDWWKTILAEIKKCDLFIYAVSDDSLGSEYCQKEAKEAVQLNKQLLPVIIRPLKTEYPADAADDLVEILRSKQYVELSTGLDETSLMKLWSSIHMLLMPNVESTGRLNLRREERWILSNQFAILAKLYPDEEDSYTNMREIVERGYELHYDWISEYIYDGNNVMTEKECLEVLDILDMFSFMKYAHESITDQTDIDEVWLHFHGFDGNTEGKQVAYTRFLVEREEKYTFLDRGDRYNSHMPILRIYRFMVDEWQKSNDQFNLTKNDLIRITSAPRRNRDNHSNILSQK